MQGYVAQFYKGILYEHFGGKCVYCGRNISVSEMEVDHVIPKTKGGNSSFRNSLPTCMPCNRRKNNKPPPIPVQLPLDIKRYRIFPMIKKVRVHQLVKRQKPSPRIEREVKDDQA